jgi:predicted metal-dependent hydrolase
VSDRAKRLRIAVYADGDVIVTKPADTSKAKLKLFVESRKHWIINKLDQKSIPQLKNLQKAVTNISKSIRLRLKN